MLRYQKVSKHYDCSYHCYCYSHYSYCSSNRKYNKCSGIILCIYILPACCQTVTSILINLFYQGFFFRRLFRTCFFCQLLWWDFWMIWICCCIVELMCSCFSFFTAANLILRALYHHSFLKEIFCNEIESYFTWKQLSGTSFTIF